jgi:hypothetical protein
MTTRKTLCTRFIRIAFTTSHSSQTYTIDPSNLPSTFTNPHELYPKPPSGQSPAQKPLTRPTTPRKHDTIGVDAGTGSKSGPYAIPTWRDTHLQMGKGVCIGSLNPPGSIAADLRFRDGACGIFRIEWRGWDQDWRCAWDEFCRGWWRGDKTRTSDGRASSRHCSCFGSC